MYEWKLEFKGYDEDKARKFAELVIQMGGVAIVHRLEGYEMGSGPHFQGYTVQYLDHFDIQNHIHAPSQPAVNRERYRASCEGESDNCKCGHPYYRHFDSYEPSLPHIGCKYCECYTFEDPEKRGVSITMVEFTPGIIVAYEKHGDFFYDATTPDRWAINSLAILTHRFNEGYWYLTPDERFPLDEEPSKWHGPSLPQLIPDFPQEGTKEEKNEAILAWKKVNVETIADEDAKALVLKKLKSAISNWNERAEYVKWYNEVERIVKEKDLSEHTWIDSKGDTRTRHEPKAWVILNERSGHEYERIEFEELRMFE